MAGKLVPLDEAAKTLGVSPDELNSMRENRDIYGYRDGATWKFKPEDIERLKVELAERAAPASDSSSLPVDLADSDSAFEDSAFEDSAFGDSATDDSATEDSEGDEIVLLSEIELGGSGASTSSTIIGPPGKGQSPEDSDIKLAIGSGVELIGQGSSTVIGKENAPGSSVLGSSRHDSGSDVLPVDLDSESPIELAAEGSDKKQGSGSDLTLVTQESTGEGIDGGSDLTLVTDGSSKSLDSGSDLTLGAADEGDVFRLQDSAAGSSVKLKDGGSVLDSPGTGTGSDITISPGDSGINLIDPSDSGLSLEEPLELGAADDGDSSFDLSSSSSDSSDSGTLSDSAEFDSDAVMELQGEDDFLLTPLEESLDDESQDSGSQVIALDSDSDFTDAGAVLGGPPAATAMLEADDLGMGDALGAPVDVGAGLAMSPTMAAAPGAMMMAPVREAQYTWVNVMFLSFCVLFLALTGMMMFDLMRNMWSWDGHYPATSPLMDMVLSMFGA
ncbi:MAG TPA: helix-turn-helix domain-containing protein [Pirellulales bacterium]|nr:helix-turn-helix domain-containing protein [Pirellulales bacterium]